jgi:hypothetical protein
MGGQVGRCGSIEHAGHFDLELQALDLPRPHLAQQHGSRCPDQPIVVTFEGFLVLGIYVGRVAALVALS